jgi:hypothetical protein
MDYELIQQNKLSHIHEQKIITKNLEILNYYPIIKIIKLIFIN